MCGCTAGSISFLLSLQFFVLVLETPVWHIRTLTRRVTWSISRYPPAHSSFVRYRRKLRMTDRHQRGILRGVLTASSCFVPGVQDPLIPRSLTVHYYDGNYGAIIRINRDAHRNKPQTVLLRIARRNRDYLLWVATTRLSLWSIGFPTPRHLSRLKYSSLTFN